ncbi:cation/cationic drug transporter [Corynebacterium mustelae]|uniref:Cation/cationic drug transporter n=1 Tax=Corynebacterium mustelae TaxID=571915 RepID=A0A0G3H4S5_9CORY|nr:cation/cationic drug transporter [Corynebacterium mustelae]
MGRCTVLGVGKWWLLTLTVCCEVTATLCLKAALSYPWLYAIVVAGYVASYWLLSVLLRRGMPLGVTYGIWGACGVALTAVLGSVFYQEHITVLSGIGIAVIIAGIALVEFGSPHSGGN